LVKTRSDSENAGLKTELGYADTRIHGNEQIRMESWKIKLE
jgi:hypothetical protein